MTPFTHQDLVAQLPGLTAFARSLTGAQDRAEDLVQETAMRALRSVDRFEPGTNLRAWLFTILRNTHYSQHRTTRRYADADEGYIESLLVHSGNQEHVVELKETLQRIEKLPARLRDPLMRVAEGQTYEEISFELSTSLGTIKSRVNRGRDELFGRRALMKEYAPRLRPAPTQKETPMAFEEVAPLHASQKKVAPDAVTIAFRPYAKMPKPALVLSIGGHVMKKLGWKAEQRVRVLWGTKEDLGKLRIEAVAEDKLGWDLKANKPKTIFKLIISNMPEGVNFAAKFKNTSCDHIEMDGGEKRYALITLPNDFFIGVAAPVPAGTVLKPGVPFRHQHLQPAGR